VILEATSIALTLAAGCEYLRSRRGPLELASIALLHTRAALLCLRREAARVPGRWRNEYQFSLRDVKEQG